jgi:hypothetical protein
MVQCPLPVSLPNSDHASGTEIPIPEDHQRVAAVMQQLFVHMDLDRRRPIAFAPDVGASIAQLMNQHAALPLPNGVERSLD